MVVTLFEVTDDPITNNKPVGRFMCPILPEEGDVVMLPDSEAFLIVDRPHETWLPGVPTVRIYGRHVTIINLSLPS